MKELILADLNAGEIIHVIAGEGEETNEYRFRVLEPGDRPACEFSHRPSYDDTIVGPVRVKLEGCVNIVLDDDATEEMYEESEGGVEQGDGVLRQGGVIAIFDDRDAPPIPRIRRIMLPTISGIFVMGH